jgi:hypothetical protein
MHREATQRDQGDAFRHPADLANRGGRRLLGVRRLDPLSRQRNGEPAGADAQQRLTARKAIRFHHDGVVGAMCLHGASS